MGCDVHLLLSSRYKLDPWIPCGSLAFDTLYAEGRRRFVFKKGDTITVDGTTYIADYVGPMVESNMKALGHATLFFNRKVPKAPLANAIYFDPDESQALPQFKLDDDIVYEHI